MAFPVTLNGRTYTLADFSGTNYVEGFPDALQDFVTQAGNIYTTTSTSSVAIGTGSKTFTVADSGKPYTVGTPLRISDAAAPATNWIDAIVTSYSGTTLVVNAVAYAGSGTIASWNVNIGGSAIAYTGTLPIAQGGTGATTAADARTNLDTYSKAEADSRFLNVSGEASNVTMTGNVTIGDAGTDTLTVNATATMADATLTTADINGGTIDGTVIGGTTPAAISGTTGVFGVTSLSASNTYGTPALGTGSASSFSAFHVEAHTSGNSNGPYIGLMRSQGTQASPTNLVSGDYIGVLTGQAFQTAGSFPYRDSAVIRFVADAAHSSTSLPSRIEFLTTAASNVALTERMRIDSSGNVLCGSDGGGDIGSSTKRFKDLYLSGGVYLGGTGAANYLDDYEEGTWAGSVLLSGFTQSVSTIAGTYTKVGRLVNIHYELTLSSAGYASGYSQLTGLPFTSASANQAGGYYATGSLGNNVTGGTHFIDGSSANFYLFQSTSTSNGSIWYGSFSYYTA